MAGADIQGERVAFYTAPRYVRRLIGNAGRLHAQLSGTSDDTVPIASKTAARRIFRSPLLTVGRDGPT